MATILQLPSFLGASSAERMFCLWYLLCEIVEKVSYLLDKKVRKKNQIPEYHVFSPKGYDEDWYMSNQSMIKSSNLMGYLGAKLKDL